MPASVIEKHIERLGGRSRLKSIETVVAGGRIQLQSHAGKIEMVTKSPNKNYQSIDLNVFKQKSGCNGESAWKSGPNGTQQLTGKELQGARENALLNRVLYYQDPDVFQSVETRGTEDVDGRPAHAIEFVFPSGNKSVSFFDAESFDLVKTSSGAEVDSTEFEREVFFGAHREVDGIVVPFTIRQVTPFNETSITLKTYDINVEVDDELFEPPR